MADTITTLEIWQGICVITVKVLMIVYPSGCLLSYKDMIQLIVHWIINLSSVPLWNLESRPSLAPVRMKVQFMSLHFPHPSKMNSPEFTLLLS